VPREVRGIGAARSRRRSASPRLEAVSRIGGKRASMADGDSARYDSMKCAMPPTRPSVTAIWQRLNPTIRNGIGLMARGAGDELRRSDARKVVVRLMARATRSSAAPSARWHHRRDWQKRRESAGCWVRLGDVRATKNGMISGSRS